MPQSKRCARCGETKPTDDWPPAPKRRDGLFPYCRACKRETDREYQRRHSSDISERRKAAYAANPEPAKARRKARYYADPARAVADATRWNRENTERRREINRRYQQANMQGTVREGTRRRYATRKGAPAIHFTPEQLDHVKPLSRGGWHCLSNLRPACRPCNAQKRDRWPL